MQIIYILLLTSLGVLFWYFIKPLMKNESKHNKLHSEPSEKYRVEEPSPKNTEPAEILKIDDPIPNDPEPTPEMPIKPQPVNCKKGIFLPAPEKFNYVDCCGNKLEGIGYEVWEKRAPVNIDINQEFVGMEILDEEAFQDC